MGLKSASKRKQLMHSMCMGSIGCQNEAALCGRDLAYQVIFLSPGLLPFVCYFNLA